MPECLAMNHVPYSNTFLHHKFPLLVPQEAEVSVTLAELEDFPYEAGWDADAFLNLDFHPRTHGRSVPEIARFVQLWLYFGVISASLDAPVKVANFLNPENDSPVLGTHHLHDMVLEFLRHGQHLPQDKKDAMRINLAEAIGFMRRISPALTSITADSYKLYAQLEYALAILGSTLLFAVPQMFDRKAMASDIREGSIRLWGDHWPVPMLLKQLFGARGWCPSDLPRLSKLVSVNALSYAVTLPRLGNTDHIKCSEQGCTINTVDEATYTTQHREVECKCALIEDTCSQACKVLSKHTYPLICLDALSTGSPHVEVVPYQSGMKYTAISHVWSDGLGNSKVNALAVCQLLHIKSLVENIADTGYIWIDTLCVPLDATYRKEAILRMTETYEQASQVLVFDSEIQRVTHRDKADHEAFAQIAISGWMRRVWTLQEGVLAAKLFVEFQDGVLDVSTAVEALNEATNAKDFELDMVPVEFMLLVGILGGIRGMRTRENEFFINVWNAVRLRRTTRRGDEILCFASMLHLPLRPIVEAAEYQEKMKACISMLTYVPAGLLWSPGRKLQIDGYRWAPYSFLQEEPVDPAWSTIKRDEQGLRTLNFAIFLNHFNHTEFSETPYYQDQNGLVLDVRIAQSSYWDGSPFANNGQHLAILTDTNACEAYYNDEYLVRGILVSVLTEEGQWGPHCRYECAVDWGTIPQERVKQKLVGTCTRSKQALKWHLS